MNAIDKRIEEKISNILKWAYEDGVQYSETIKYITKGNTTSNISKVILSKLLFANGLTQQMINDFIKRNDYNIDSLIERIKDETTIEPEVEEEATKDETIEEDLDLEDLEVPKHEEEIVLEDLEVPEYEEEQEAEEQEHEEEIILEDLEVPEEDEEQEDRSTDDDEERLEEDENLEDEEEHDIKPELTEKAKKLIAKVEMLTAKIEKEKNPLKRHITAFRVKMLMAKIQKEIDLQNIRSKYELKKKQLKTKKEESELENEDNIAKTTAQIKQLKKELKGNEEYDYKSKNFMYPKEHVEKNGGLQEFSKKLQKSKSAETQNAGQKMELMETKRKELQKLQDKLNTYKEELKNSDAIYNKKVSGLEFKQKSLIVAEKANIFTWIKSTFSNITGQVKTYLEERKENKALQAEQMKEEQELEDTYIKQIEELREQLENAKQEMREKNEADRQSQTEQNGKDMASSFKEQISNMKNYSQIPDEQEHEEELVLEELEVPEDSEEPEI